MKEVIITCRKSNLSVDDIKKSSDINKILITYDKKKFLDACISIYEGYLNILNENKEDDFDGLAWRAIKLIRHGQNSFIPADKEEVNIENIRFIMINGICDLSKMSYSLIHAIKSENSTIQFFCDGADIPSDAPFKIPRKNSDFQFLSIPSNWDRQLQIQKLDCIFDLVRLLPQNIKTSFL
jgi:hypothetical protein